MSDNNAKCDNCGRVPEDECLHSLVSSQATQMDRLDRIDKKLDICVTGLYGPDLEPEQGLLVRVHSLEQSRAGMIKAIWAVFAGVASLAAKSLISLVGMTK
jgi:hypothetical protein